MSNATPNHEQRIRDRAYDLWEREARPEGRAHTHWEQAEREAGASEADPASLPPADALEPSPPTPDGTRASEAGRGTMPLSVKRG